jgi:hypothetical protein
VELPENEPAIKTVAVHFHRLFLTTSAAALSLVNTALIVAGYQQLLPRTVGTLSAIRPSAIAWNVDPLARSAMIRRVISAPGVS